MIWNSLMGLQSLNDSFITTTENNANVMEIGSLEMGRKNWNMLIYLRCSLNLYLTSKLVLHHKIGAHRRSHMQEGSGVQEEDLRCSTSDL